jgi:hypothetical protein
MLRTSSPQRQLSLGYEFLPPAPSQYPFHAQLRVWLRNCPTRHHYDPEVVQCLVLSAAEGCELLCIRHPWPEATRYRVGCGLIALNDRKDKRIEAFTFGGALAIDTNETQTTCVFRSPAPILALSNEGTLARQFAAEVLALFAEQRAVWNVRQPQEVFERRLAGVAPLPLYLACLVSMRRRLQPMATAGDRAVPLLLHLLDRAQRELELAGCWPASPITLDELLVP